MSPAAEGAPVGFAAHAVPFEVLRSWKGGLSGSVIIHTAGNSAACGRSYNEGEAYLIYAGVDEAGKPWDSLCSRTRASKGSADDFTVLDGLKPGDGKPPATEPPETTETEKPADDPGDASTVSTEAAETPAAEPKPKAAPDTPECAFASWPPTVGLALLPLLAVRRRRR
jgi:hypothetical protein